MTDTPETIATEIATAREREVAAETNIIELQAEARRLAAQTKAAAKAAEEVHPATVVVTAPVVAVPLVPEPVAVVVPAPKHVAVPASKHVAVPVAPHNPAQTVPARWALQPAAR